VCVCAIIVLRIYNRIAGEQLVKSFKRRDEDNGDEFGSKQ